MPLDEKEMGLVAEIGSCRTRGGGSWTRSFTVETAGEEGKGLPGLRRVVGEVFIGVEHPGVEIADSYGPGIVLGEEEDAGSEGAGGMGEDGPDEPLGILDRGEVAKAGIVPIDESTPGEEPETTDRERDGGHHVEASATSGQRPAAMS